jgi:hypothetical protein
MVTIPLDYLRDRSRIVNMFAMQALADLVKQDARWRPKVMRVLEEQTKVGNPTTPS